VFGCGLALLFPGPVWASEQSELEYAKGIVEYSKGNYREALEHFQTVVNLTPDDANARFYLGLSESRVGEFSAAIPHLEKALQLDPSMNYVYYHLGLSYFQEQRYPEALSALERAAQFDPQNAAVQFYQGSTLYQLKRYQEALPPFDRALQLDPALTLSGQYYRGLTLFALEDDSRARAAFEAARTAEPTSTIGQNSARYLDALKARERDRRLWQVEGSASLQYDSNVMLADGSVTSREADGSAVFNVAGRAFAMRTSQQQLGAEYDFFQSLHFRLNSFDIRSHTFGLFGRMKLEPATLRLGLNYNLIALDNERFSESFTLQPSVLIQQTQNWLGLISVHYRPENYFGENDVPAGQLRSVRGRDGWNVRTGFDQFWLFNQRQSYARLSYHYDVQRSDGSDWDYHGHEVGLGVQTPLWAGLTLNANGSYYRFNYENVNSFSCCPNDPNNLQSLGNLEANDTQIRHDSRYTVGVALSRDVGPYLTFSAGFLHISNFSNISFFDYHRNIVTLAVSGRY
jgi:Flp pilus assembly protein TadD